MFFFKPKPLLSRENWACLGTPWAGEHCEHGELRNAPVTRWRLPCQKPLDTGFQLHGPNTRVQSWELVQD